MKNYIALFAVSIGNLKKPKIWLVEKSLDLSIICSKCKNEDEKIFKEEEELIKILKFHGWTENI